MNPGKVDAVKAIKEMTGGYGCDIYIEATGHPASVQQGLEAIRKMGTFVEFSVFGDLVKVDWSIISDRKELNLLGSHLSPYCYDTVIDGLAMASPRRKASLPISSRSKSGRKGSILQQPAKTERLKLS